MIGGRGRGDWDFLKEVWLSGGVFLGHFFLVGRGRFLWGRNEGVLRGSKIGDGA